MHGSSYIESSLIVMTCKDTSSLYLGECNKDLDKNEYKIRVRGADGVIYRNKFCAICNNVRNYTYLTYVFHGFEYDSYTTLFDKRQSCRLSRFSQIDPFKLDTKTIYKRYKR